MLKQKFFIDFGSKIGVYFFTALAGIIVTRIAGPEVIGTVLFGYSFVSVFFFLFGLFGPSHIKLISGGANIKDCFRIYSVIMFITAVIFCLAVLLFFFIKKQIYDIEFSRTEEIVILISMLLVGLQGIFKIADITLTAQMKQVKINIPLVVRTVIYNLGRIILVILGYKAIALVTMQFVAALLMIPVYLYLIRNEGYFNGKWDKGLFQKYLKIGIPILVITVTLSIINNYSKVLLKDFSTIQELGFYGGAIGLASMLVKIGESAGSLFFPLFSKAFSEGEYDLIESSINKFVYYQFILILPVVIVLSVNSNTIIPFLLGDSYKPSVPIFSVLIFYSFFQILCIPYYNLINGLNEFKKNSYFHIIFMIFFFGCFYFLTHRDYLNMGGLGLAISFLALHVFKLIVWYLFANTIISIRLMRSLLTLSLAFAIIYFLNDLFYESFVREENYLIKILFMGLDLLLIYMILYMLGFIKKENISYITDLLNIKSLKDYFKSEIK